MVNLDMGPTVIAVGPPGEEVIFNWSHVIRVIRVNDPFRGVVGIRVVSRDQSSWIIEYLDTQTRDRDFEKLAIELKRPVGVGKPRTAADLGLGSTSGAVGSPKKP